jgi:hypothetical protein
MPLALLVALALAPRAHADTVTLDTGAVIEGDLAHYEFGGDCQISVTEGSFTGVILIVPCHRVESFVRTAVRTPVPIGLETEAAKAEAEAAMTGAATAAIAGAPTAESGAAIAGAATTSAVTAGTATTPGDLPAGASAGVPPVATGSGAGVPPVSVSAAPAVATAPAQPAPMSGAPVSGAPGSGASVAVPVTRPLSFGQGLSSVSLGSAEVGRRDTADVATTAPPPMAAAPVEPDVNEGVENAGVVGVVEGTPDRGVREEPFYDEPLFPADATTPIVGAADGDGDARAQDTAAARPPSSAPRPAAAPEPQHHAVSF